MALFKHSGRFNCFNNPNDWLRISITGLLLAYQTTLSAADAPASINDALYNLRVHNYALAAAQLTPLAEAGDAEAQYRLGTLYLKGQGVDKNTLIAADWLKQSAKQANTNACYQLGKLLETNRDIEADLNGAISAYRCAQAGGKQRATDDIERVKQKLARAPSADDLIAIIADGQLTALGQLLADKSWLNKPLSNGYTPLCHAIVSNQSAAVSLLITQGADIEQPSPNGQPPLVFAVTQGRPEMVETLIKLNAPINGRDQRGNSALHHAVRLDDFISSQKLLAAGADANASNDSGDHPLDFSHDTAPKIIALLEGHNAKRHLSTSTQQTQAKSVARLDYDKLLTELASNDSTYAGWPALNIAAFRGQKDIVAAMITRGADIESTDTSGQTPLMRAATQGHSDITRALLSAGANPLTPSDSGLNALSLAIKSNAADIVRQMLAQIETQSLPFSATNLLNACDNSCEETTLLTLLQNLPASTPVLQQTTLDTQLLSAASKGYFSVGAYWVEAGAQVNEKSDLGVTPLWWAAYYNDAVFAARLIAAGAQQDSADHTGKTPLHTAAERADAALLTTLNPTTEALEQIAARGNTPLMLAAAAGNKHALSWLLAHKVDVTKRNEKSLTALMITCQSDRADLAALLIEAGAKINRRNKQGKNCLEQAKEVDAAEVIALINGLK